MIVTVATTKKKKAPVFYINSALPNVLLKGGAHAVDFKPCEQRNNIRYLHAKVGQVIVRVLIISWYTRTQVFNNNKIITSAIYTSRWARSI